MTANTFGRLRGLLPPSPLLIAKVLEHHADDTSTVELPLGLGQSAVAQGVATGTQLRVRGTSVPVGAFAFVRDGVVQSRAPDGVPAEVVVGVVAAQPFGPARLAALEAPPPAQVAPVGTPYALDLAPFFTGGYAPRTYSVASGTLPGGLALSSSTGLLAGTATAAAAPSLVAVRCVDSTRRAVVLAAFAVSAA